MDRADEIARNVWPFTTNTAHNNDVVRADLAAALRQYGDERLEEAARTFETGIYGDLHRVNAPMDWPRLIRSLKSGKKEGAG